ncbi:MAG: suppressor for copper-sensitivity B, partial [Hyphomicrobiaceae bacterium]
ALVLDRAPVAIRFQTDDIVAMQADWTRSDPAISRYLEAHDRFGIPFNIVYGPSAPEGIIMSEVLSTASVMDALTAAGIQN